MTWFTEMISWRVNIVTDNDFFFFFSPWWQCNNPMTKEPKLEAAVRIVAEWTDYDQEIKRLQTRVQEGADHTTKRHSTGTQDSNTDKYSMHHLNLNASVKFLFLSRWSDPHTELWGAVAVMELWTGLCLKSPLHVEAPLLLVCRRSDHQLERSGWNCFDRMCVCVSVKGS